MITFTAVSLNCTAVLMQTQDRSGLIQMYNSQCEDVDVESTCQRQRIRPSYAAYTKETSRSVHTRTQAKLLMIQGHFTAAAVDCILLQHHPYRHRSMWLF